MSERPAHFSPSQPATTRYHLRFAATAEQVYKAFKAIANLAEKADEGTVVISVEAGCGRGFEWTWLRNAVEEPLEEADINIEKSLE